MLQSRASLTQQIHCEEEFGWLFPFIVAFVEDNANMSSIQYFQNHEVFCATPKKVDPVKLISLYK